MKNVLIALLVVVLSACASSRGFDRSALRTQIGDQKVVTEEDIKKALEAKPQLPKPFRLAIYLAPPKTPQWSSDKPWKWLREDKDKLLDVGPELKEKGVISDIFLISDSILEGTDNKAIRLAAARAGADAVIIVNGVSDIDRYNNVLGSLYGLFMVNASMWDVRNQYLYLSVEAEGSAHQTLLAFFIGESRIIKEAKSNALGALKEELSTRLASLSAK